MKYDIQEYSDQPYILDRFLDPHCLPALTAKNAKFIEGIIALDSNYAGDYDENKKPEEDDFDPEAEPNNPGSHCGSVAYWFHQMKQGQYTFSQCILGAVIAIDLTNSTRLGATINGRIQMRDIIYQTCKDLESLKMELEKPFTIETMEEHLIAKLSVPLAAKNKASERCNLSFATKFCSYAAHCLGLGDIYSKYDSVVSKKLPDYLEVYGLDDYSKPFSTDGKKHKEKLKVYLQYSEAIEKLIEQVNIPEINRETLDHIIWYANK